MEPLLDREAGRLARHSRELIALTRAVADAEARRDARLERKLAEIDARLAELERSGRPPRPLDIPHRFARREASVVDMHPRDGDRTGA